VKCCLPFTSDLTCFGLLEVLAKKCCLAFFEPVCFELKLLGLFQAVWQVVWHILPGYLADLVHVNVKSLILFLIPCVLCDHILQQFCRTVTYLTCQTLVYQIQSNEKLLHGACLYFHNLRFMFQSFVSIFVKHFL